MVLGGTVPPPTFRAPLYLQKCFSYDFEIWQKPWSDIKTCRTRGVREHLFLSLSSAILRMTVLRNHYLPSYRLIVLLLVSEQFLMIWLLLIP